MSPAVGFAGIICTIGAATKRLCTTLRLERDTATFAFFLLPIVRFFDPLLLATIFALLFAATGCALFLAAADLWMLLFLCCTAFGVTSFACATGAEKATNSIEISKDNAGLRITKLPI
ncbi:MAG: hypothetical protein ABIO19_11415 [Burkholderiaceae bacterium]